MLLVLQRMLLPLRDHMILKQSLSGMLLSMEVDLLLENLFGNLPLPLE